MASKPRRTDPAGLGLLEYDEGLKALLIGCTYKDHPSLDSLPGTERDVRGMEAALREVHFEDVQTLLNEQVTKAAIEQALSGFMVGKEATNGCLYVMLAGHGVLDNAGRSVFCCHDYSEANAFMTSIPLDTVKNMAARIVIKHQVYHLDCCHAGGMLAGKHRGIDNAWAWSQARKPAILGMTAVTADEKAIEESGSNGHGLFTASIIRGLRGEAFKETRDFLTFAELFAYAKRRVSKKALEYKRDGQSAGEMNPQTPASPVNTFSCHFLPFLP